jgi:hypothetical protein
MALDPMQIRDEGHLIAFVVDPERNLIRFACKFCGGTTEPLEVGHPLPDDFPGVPHVPSCLMLVTGNTRKAA